MPVSAISRSVAAGGRSMATPRASSTSAAPLAEEAARLPCLAIRAPAAAATIAPIVEMFTVRAPSPPVPTRSVSGPSRRSGVARSSMAWARPPSSPGVSPLIRSATPNPAICTGVAAPSMISAIAHDVSSADRVSPLISAPIRDGQVVRESTAGQRVAGALPAARSRISPARAWASAFGSIGWLITASARDHVASQPSSARPMMSSTGGQL